MSGSRSQHFESLKWKSPDWIMSRFLWLVPALLYGISASPSPGWVDATLIAHNTDSLVLSSWVNSHNLFHLLGYLWSRIFGFLDLHYSLTLLAGLFGALTVQLVYVLSRRLGASRTAALLASAGLTLSHSLWWHSAMLEVYTLNAFLIVLMLLLVQHFLQNPSRRRLLAAAAVFGLGCSNHVLVGLYLSAWIAFFVALARSERYREYARPSVLLIWLASSVAGGGLYAAVVVRDVFGLWLTGGADGLIAALHQVLDGATGGGFREYMFPSLPPAQARFWRSNYLILLVANLPSVLLPAGFIGLWVLVRQHRSAFAWFFLVGMLAQIVWSANYWIWDMYAFAMPVYVMWSIAAALGIDRVLARLSRGTGDRARTVNGPGIAGSVVAGAFSLLLAPLLYFMLPLMYERGGAVTAYFNNYEEIEQVEDTWNAVTYISRPWKTGYTAAREHAEAVLETLPPDAVYVTDDSRDDFLLRLYFKDLLHERPDVDYLPVFSPFFSRGRAVSVANRVQRELRLGRRVFVTSNEEPHDMWISMGDFELSAITLAGGGTGTIYRVRID